MIQVIRAAQRHTRDVGWLHTAWLFSFDDYVDPENMHFSALRVFNDDTVQPGGGFPDHPHQEAEIITIPLSGSLTHEDNMGNRSTITPGEVQRMSAGTGVIHAEMNTGEEPVHLYQIWFLPDTAGLPPTYEQRRYNPAQWRNRLAPIASGRGLPDVVSFHADATIYRADLQGGITLDYLLEDERCVFIYVTSGEISINNVRLDTHDQARIQHEHMLLCQSLLPTSLILIDLPPITG